MAVSGRAPRQDKLIADGQAFLARGQLSSARNRFRDAAKLAPDDPRGHFFLGAVLLAENDADGALPALRAASTLAPDNPDVAANLGLALAGTGDRAGAIAALRQALARKPGHPGFKVNLANVLIDERRYADALAELADAGDSSDVLLVRSQALVLLDRPAEALAAAEAALALEPDSPEALVAKRAALRHADRVRETLAICRRLIARGDPSREAYLVGATNLVGLADREGAKRMLADAIAAYGGPETVPVEVLQAQGFRLVGDDPKDTAEIGRLHRAAARRLEHVPAFERFENSPDPERRLRVGFVSGDFRRHAVMEFLTGPLAAFDRARLDIHLYSNVVDADVMTERARAAADGFRDIHKIPAAQVAQTIRADHIDVLVDLSGHTIGNRLDVFARRPAPVQITWLGYPYSTGFKRIRWRLTDEIADPPDRPRDDYSERLIRLDRFLCYGTRDDLAPARPRPESGPPVFGSFNNIEKYDDPTLAHWAAILARCPGSRLVVRQRPMRAAEIREAWRDRFVALGIAADRLDFAPFGDLPNAQYAIHDDVDICLDPLGYNGTTTTCTALWMGVPVIVVPGEGHAARVGASLMAAARLPEFVAADPEEAIERIVALAQDRPRLAEYRRTLRDRVRASPLCDAAGFARDFEEKLRFAWRDWCRSA
jgi:protein O-GlcNAc transferase